MYIIGDTHGCYLTFLALLKKLPTSEEIFLVGDFIDRGPRSREMIEFLIAHPEIKSVMGNHEYILPRDKNYCLSIGGGATFNSYGHQNMPIEHIKFLENLPLYIEKDGVFISHSMVLKSLEKSTSKLDSDDSILWTRNAVPKQINGNFHIFGHTPTKTPIIRKHWANIDTGCVYSGYGKLTAIHYPSLQIFQQENVDFN